MTTGPEVTTDEAVYWEGTPPRYCDTCKAPILNKFYDGTTRYGPWAHMCPNCQKLGPGLNTVGTGIAQEYTLQPDTRKWLKTAG